MSGTASVTNTFAAQTGNIPLAQLDTNYSDLVTYLNDPTNRTNYAGDTGTTNTIALAYTPAVAGYTTGLTITWKQLITNSGAVKINCNTVGAKDLVNPDGSAIQAGQLAAGGIYDGAYDGTRFICLTGFAVPATSAQVQTGTSAITFVSPSTAHSSKSAAKAWATWIGTSTGTITALESYNVASIVRMGTGTYSITFSTAFANTTWAGITGVGGSGVVGARFDGRSTTGGLMLTLQAFNVAIDSQIASFSIFGTQ